MGIADLKGKSNDTLPSLSLTPRIQSSYTSAACIGFVSAQLEGLEDLSSARFECRVIIVSNRLKARSFPVALGPVRLPYLPVIHPASRPLSLML